MSGYFYPDSMIGCVARLQYCYYYAAEAVTYSINYLDTIEHTLQRTFLDQLTAGGCEYQVRWEVIQKDGPVTAKPWLISTGLQCQEVAVSCLLRRDILEQDPAELVQSRAVLWARMCKRGPKLTDVRHMPNHPALHRVLRQYLQECATCFTHFVFYPKIT